MFLPVGVSGLLEALETAGFAAYAVGGCVRDSLLGRVPQDWDIATSARPEEVLARFPHAIPTGIAHGTVTVVWEGEPFEVTTFRAESAYTDHRHPDQVRFVPDLEADLARRDFTVNAMACRRDGQVIDRFGGREDLKNGIIRCVGDPGERFREDALRILRALRFAACYGFRLEEKTSAAVLESRELLCYVAAERIWAEFSRLLCGIDAGRVLREFPQVIFAILPELFPMEGFLQYNPHHDRDVWEHTCAAVEASSPELAVRLAMLLHDCGKPGCFTLDGEGTGHFYGHAQKSLELAGTVLRRLRVPRLLGERVLLLIHLHDRPVFPEERWVKRQLGRWGRRSFSSGWRSRRRIPWRKPWLSSRPVWQTSGRWRPPPKPFCGKGSASASNSWRSPAAICCSWASPKGLKWGRCWNSWFRRSSTARWKIRKKPCWLMWRSCPQAQGRSREKEGTHGQTTGSHKSICAEPSG